MSCFLADFTGFHPNYTQNLFHRYATFKYECNNINADCLKKNNIKNLIRGYSRIDFTKVIITHPNIAQNTQNFFPDSLVVFVPYHNFLGRFSQNNAEIGLCFDEKKHVVLLCICHPNHAQNLFYRYATFRYECNTINADCLKKITLKIYLGAIPGSILLKLP